MSYDVVTIMFLWLLENEDSYSMLVGDLNTYHHENDEIFIGI